MAGVPYLEKFYLQCFVILRNSCLGKNFHFTPFMNPRRVDGQMDGRTNGKNKIKKIVLSIIG